jgi:uncharacterized membrane-anchored protein YhcB (DUF1043 family)
MHHEITAQVNLDKLREKITTHFNESELRDLCFKLNVDYDDLRSEGKGDKARELVAYCERHGRISELLGICQQLRPRLSW